MKKTIFYIVVGSSLVACASGSRSMSYDEYAQLTREDQVRVFNEITPENRANLVRTQAERWLDAYREGLTAEQIVIAEEAIAFIRPELYGTGGPPAEEVDALQDRLMRELPAEFVRGAFSSVTSPPPEK